MNSQKRQLIEELAEVIRHDHSIPCPITNIYPIVKELGGEIWSLFNPLLLFGGRIFKPDDERNFVIQIYAKEPESYECYTIARQLGHLFIHLGYLYDSDRWNKLDGKHYFEICSAEDHMVADQFANSLLMPKSELIRYIDRIEDDQVNMTELAQHFNVPERIALIRCKELDLVAEEY